MEEYQKSSDQLTSKLTRILANLLAKLTGTNPNGGHGGGSPSASPRASLGPGNTLGRGSYACSPWVNPPEVGLCHERWWWTMRLMRLMRLWDYSARLLVISVILARLLAYISSTVLALLPTFRTFFGRLFLVNSRSCIHIDYLYYIHVFFSDDVLRRNYLINRVDLFEEKSILVFPECLEASEW